MLPLQPRAKLLLLLPHLPHLNPLQERRRTVVLQPQRKRRSWRTTSSPLKSWDSRWKFPDSENYPNFLLCLTGSELSWNTASPRALTPSLVSTSTLYIWQRSRIYISGVLESAGITPALLLCFCHTLYQLLEFDKQYNLHFLSPKSSKKSKSFNKWLNG